MNFIFFLLIFFIPTFAGNGEVGDKTIVRELYIQKISEQFKTSNIVVVQGLPGMGKTHLVQSFMNAKKDQYQKILLLNWDRLSFKEQLLHLTKSLRPNPEKGSFSLEEGFIKGLKEFPNQVLLIIDNLGGLEDIQHLLDALKDLGHVNVLLATRSNATLYPSVKLGVFLIHESKMALKGVAPTIDENSASKIAEALGNYPYFVVKVGKMISNSPTVNAKRLLDILIHNQEGAALQVEGRPPVEGRPSVEHSPLKDVSIAFLNREEEHMENQGKDMQSRGARAILEKINWMKTENPQGFEALVFLSHLNTKTIPIDLLHHYFNDENEADKIIKFLIDNDFITGTDKRGDFITFDIHKITQDIVKSATSQKEQKGVFHKIPDAFVKFYHKNFSALVDGDREDQVYYSHLFKLLGHVKEDALLLPLNILYLKRSLYSQRDTEEAIKIFAKTERCLQSHVLEDKKLLADYLADCIFMKGFMHANNSKKFQEGIKDGYKAIKLYETIKNNEGVFKSYTRMAWISLYQGNSEECAFYLSKLDHKRMPLVENYIAKEYLFVQSWYNLNVRNYPKCIEFSLKGIEINQYSKNIYLGLYFWVQLSYAYAKLGQLDEALKTNEEGLVLEQGLFQKNGTLARAAFLSTKALIFLYQNNPLEAKGSVKESLHIFKSIMNDTPYQDTAVALRILGEIELKLQNYDEAINALESSRKMFQALSPKNECWRFAESLRLLCLAWIKTENREKFEETYHFLKENFGEDHEEIQNLQRELLKEGFRYLL